MYQTFKVKEAKGKKSLEDLCIVILEEATSLFQIVKATEPLKVNKSSISVGNLVIPRCIPGKKVIIANKNNAKMITGQILNNH